MTRATRPRVTERAFQQSILDLAKRAGWRVAHFRSVLTPTGYRTPVAADGAGFPDLLLCHPKLGLLVLECKQEDKYPRPEQRAWLQDLRAAGVEACVVRPSDWPWIESVLMGTRARGVK